MEPAVRFFKALADESRLRIVGLLAERERSVEELAERLGVTPPTVSHHLNRLKEIGLVQMEAQGTTHLYRLDTKTLNGFKKEVFSPERIAALTASESERRGAAGTVGGAGDEGDEFERRVMRDYFDGERLKQVPMQRKKRWVVLRWLAERFQQERRYTEKEVNAIIKRHHEDTAWLRRELVDGRLMRREGGMYWRVPDPASASAGRKWEY